MKWQLQKGSSKNWNTVRADGEGVSFNTQYGPKEWSEKQIGRAHV